MKMQSSLLPAASAEIKAVAQIIQSIEILQFALAYPLLSTYSKSLWIIRCLKRCFEEKEGRGIKKKMIVARLHPMTMPKKRRVRQAGLKWPKTGAITIRKPPVRRSSFSEERDQKQEALENTAAQPMSLHDYLMGQLSSLTSNHLMEACEISFIR